MQWVIKYVSKQVAQLPKRTDNVDELRSYMIEIRGVISFRKCNLTNIFYA